MGAVLSQTKIAGAGSFIAGANKDWVNATNITANDTNYAICNTNTSPGVNSISDILVSGTHGFTIPTGAVITGIVLMISRKSARSDSHYDYKVKLSKDGSTEAGDDKKIATVWGSSFEDTNYGSSTDVWGQTWSAAEINAGGFGCLFQVENQNVSNAPAASVNYINITVYYTLPSGSFFQLF